jgi:hypothetical protein
MGSSSSRRRWLAPEVVQTSAMDCGPAALKCLLSPALLLAGLLVAAAGIVFEALLLRGVMNIAGELRLVEQRLQALGYFLVFALALLLVDWRVAGGLLRQVVRDERDDPVGRGEIARGQLLDRLRPLAHGP